MMIKFCVHVGCGTFYDCAAAGHQTEKSYIVPLLLELLDFFINWSQIVIEHCHYW